VVAEYKKSGSAEAFLEALVPMIEEITGETINVTIQD